MDNKIFKVSSTLLIRTYTQIVGAPKVVCVCVYEYQYIHSWWLLELGLFWLEMWIICYEIIEWFMWSFDWFEVAVHVIVIYIRGELYNRIGGSVLLN